MDIISKILNEKQQYIKKAGRVPMILYLGDNEQKELIKEVCNRFGHSGSVVCPPSISVDGKTFDGMIIKEVIEPSFLQAV